jgi:twinkle protein
MSGLSDSHAEWLENRRLSVEIAVKHGWHSRGPSIAIPYIVKGKTLYVKTKDPTDKRRQRCHPEGIEQVHLWNTDCLDESPGQDATLWLTEGEEDALALLQCGQQYVVSMPSGSQDTASGARSKAEKVLARRDGSGLILDPRIAKFRRIAVMTDGDSAGIHLRNAVVDLVGREYCWVPTYPDGTKDANDVLRLGADAMARLIETIQPVRSDGFIDFITADTQTPTLKPMNCGIPFLHRHFRPVRPSFIVIGGPAGQGKSSITQSLLYSLLWANEDLRASIFHAEGNKRIPVRRARLFWRNQVNPPQMSDEIKLERDRWVADRFGFIAPPQDEVPDFKWFLWAMEQQALYRKRNVFVIDPWNQVLHSVPKGANKTDYIGDCIWQMKRVAERLGLIIIVAHHTTKEDDPMKPPTPYKLADSAHWYNAADHLLLCWRRKPDENAVMLNVAKSKDHELMGRPGHVWVRFATQKDSTGNETITDFRLMQMADPRPATRPNGLASEPEATIDNLM